MPVEPAERFVAVLRLTVFLGSAVGVDGIKYSLQCFFPTQFVGIYE